MITRSLAFTRDLKTGEAEIIVVANGCRDDTAALARSMPQVTVVELEASGKIGALNAGDRRATAFPRIYLDGDVYMTASTVRALASALTEDRPLIAAPRVVFETTGRPWGVRAFFRIYRLLPYVNEGLTGLGVYGLSAEGRRRFDAFPDVTGDDLFVQRSFELTERLTIDAPFVVETPRTLASLLKVRTRAAFGNRELAEQAEDAFATSTTATLKALAGMLLRKPRLLPAAIVFVAVTAEARRRVRQDDGSVWHRDSTTR